MKVLHHILLLIFVLSGSNVWAQTEKEDLIKNAPLRLDTPSIATIKDTAKLQEDTIPKHDHRKATLRSALIPGWGQAYNKEYWKIPLVYTAIGIPVGMFVYNNTWYKRSKKAYEIMVNNDTASFPLIHPKLNGISSNSLQFYRNQFRRDRDYSLLYTLIAWGLNVADATVFAHLKNFDVSDDLSFKIEPGYSPLAKTSGVSFVLAIK